MLEPGERIFGMEHATKRAASVSHLNQPTNFDISQLYTGVKILPTDYTGAGLGLNTSILQVQNGILTPKDIFIPGEGNESTNIRQIESVDAMEILYTADGTSVPRTHFDFNTAGTRICTQNVNLEPLTVSVDFSAFKSTPVWNGEPMNLIYVHCCTDPLTAEYKSLDTSGETWGGGIFFNLYSDETPTDDTWTPLLVGTQISSRVIAVPLTYTQTKIKLMVKGCKSWSLEFLTYITGI